MQRTSEARILSSDTSLLEIRKSGQKGRHEKLKVSDITREFFEPALPLRDFGFKLIKQVAVVRLPREILIGIIA